jgi:hypothetical protein
MRSAWIGLKTGSALRFFPKQLRSEVELDFSTGSRSLLHTSEPEKAESEYRNGSPR